MTEKNYEFIQPLMTNLGGFLKAHFAGGTWVVWAALIGFGGFQTLHVKWLNKRLDDVKIERDEYMNAANNRGAVVNSQAKTAERKSQDQEEKDDVEIKIINADNPADATFHWLRQRREAKSDNSDE